MKLGARIGVVLGVSLLTLVLISAASYYSIHTFLEHAGAVRHTQEVLTSISSLTAHVANAESARRGHFLVNDESYYQQFQTAIEGISTEKGKLRLLVADNPSMLAQLDSFDSLHNQRQANWQAMFALQKQGALTPEKQAALMEQNRALRSKEFALLDAVRAAELMLLQQSDAESGDQARNTLILAGIGVALSIAFVAFFGYGILKEIAARRLAEEALRMSESHLRTILETEPECVQRVAADGTLLEMNPAGLAMIEALSAAEVVGKSVFGLVVPEHRDAFRQLTERVCRGESGGLEFEIVGLRGTRRWLHTRAVPLRRENDGVTELLSVTRDITERKHAEQKIRRLNRVYSVLSDINQIIVRERNPNAVLAAACQTAVTQGNFRMAWIGMLDGAGGSLLPVAQAGVGDGYLENIRIGLDGGPESQGPTGTAMREGRHFLCNDIEHDACMAPWREQALRLGYRSSASFPLKKNGQVAGAFNLYAAEPQFFDDEEIKLLDELAADVSFALEAIEAQQQREQAEQALRESEQHYRSLFENMLEGFAYCRLILTGDVPHDFQYILVNKAFEELTGLKNVTGKLVSEVVPGIQQSNPELFEIYGRVVRTGQPEKFETFIAPMGIWFSIAAYRPAMGHFVAIFENITERKRREESERKLFHAVEQSEEIIFMTELDGTITYVNPAFQKIYGFTKEEALGKTPRILKSGARVREDYEQFWKTLLAGKSIRGEFENRTKAGRLITISTTVSPVFDSQGKMTGFIAVQEDITARRFSEEALQQSEARYRKLFEDSTLGIFRATEDGKFLDANSAMVEMLGYASRQELLAASLVTDIYVHPEEREQLIRLCLENQMNRSSAVEWSRKDGTSIFVRLTGRAQRNASGGIEFFEDFVEDVTERLAIEKQFYAAQKFEAIGHLAGGVAHDFNNVLGAIMGWAELCLDSAPADPRLQKGLGVIIEQANHAVGLTRQLLAFARRQHMEPRVINLNNSVQEVSSLLGSVIGRDIELKTKLAPDLFSTLADPTHVEQVIMNLCVNARDAMPRGGKLVIETKNADVDEDYCHSHPYALPGNYVQLSVSDTGVGMDAATLDHVFEPFFTTKAQGKGTGLGLATVYGIAKQHGGFIHAYSEVGQGTTFNIYFPSSQSAAQAEIKAEPLELRGGSETILIGEDNEDLAELTGAALEGMGYSVLRARNGEEAVALFSRHADRVALLLFDVVMPKLSGPDAYAKIRAQRDDIPVLFISGHSFESPALSSFVERGAELLQKPFSRKALLSRVRAVLDRT